MQADREWENTALESRSANALAAQPALASVPVPVPALASALASVNAPGFALAPSLGASRAAGIRHGQAHRAFSARPRGRGAWGMGPVGLWTWKGLPSCRLAVCLYGQPKRCALLAGAVAFLACGAGFFDGELVGVAAFVCGPAALGGDFALARRVHGSKAAPRRFAVVLQGTANTTGFVCGGAATGAGRGLCRGTCSPACALVCRPGNGLGICAVACSHVFLSSGMGTAGAERRSLLQHHPQMSKMRA